MHERKRHAARPVASTRFAALSLRGGGTYPRQRYLPWLGGGENLCYQGDIYTAQSVPTLVKGT